MLKVVTDLSRDFALCATSCEAKAIRDAVFFLPATRIGPLRRVLRKLRYPPDHQAEATKLVLEQAETLRADWAA